MIRRRVVPIRRLGCCQTTLRWKYSSTDDIWHLCRGPWPALGEHEHKPRFGFFRFDMSATICCFAILFILDYVLLLFGHKLRCDTKGTPTPSAKPSSAGLHPRPTRLGAIDTGAFPELHKFPYYLSYPPWRTVARVTGGYVTGLTHIAKFDNSTKRLNAHLGDSHIFGTKRLNAHLGDSHILARKVQAPVPRKRGLSTTFLEYINQNRE